MKVCPIENKRSQRRAATKPEGECIGPGTYHLWQVMQKSFLDIFFSSKFFKKAFELPPWGLWHEAQVNSLPG